VLCAPCRYAAQVRKALNPVASWVWFGPAFLDCGNWTQVLAEYHGLTGLPVYGIWRAMHQRCRNPQNASYADYGGRGITICERWNHPIAFLADMGHPPEGMTLGRIDNDGNYEPSNCRWETQEQQNENTRRNRYVTWQGRTQTAKAWAKELDIEPRKISERLRRGWSVERALTTPCPRGYERGRAAALERAAELWAANGARYRRNRQARKEGLPIEQVEHKPRLVKGKRGRSKRKASSQGRCTAEVRARVLELRGEGMTCRAIAERLPISKSTVASLLRAA
jgi:hypothetical protein